jgi:hypothetical protein
MRVGGDAIRESGVDLQLDAVMELGFARGCSQPCSRLVAVDQSCASLSASCELISSITELSQYINVGFDADRQGSGRQGRGSTSYG